MERKTQSKTSFSDVFFFFFLFYNSAYFISADIQVYIPNFAKLMASTGSTLHIHIVVHVVF